MLKHNVEDDFDPDGMGVALNLSMNYEVGQCSICCMLAVSLIHICCMAGHARFRQGNTCQNFP